MTARKMFLYSGGLQVADAPLARQPADAKPAALAGEGRSSAASGKPGLWRPRAEPPPVERAILTRSGGTPWNDFHICIRVNLC